MNVVLLLFICLVNGYSINLTTYIQNSTLTNDDAQNETVSVNSTHTFQTENPITPENQNVSESLNQMNERDDEANSELTTHKRETNKTTQQPSKRRRKRGISIFQIIGVIILILIGCILVGVMAWYCDKDANPISATTPASFQMSPKFVAPKPSPKARRKHQHHCYKHTHLHSDKQFKDYERYVSQRV